MDHNGSIILKASFFQFEAIPKKLAFKVKRCGSPRNIFYIGGIYHFVVQLKLAVVGAEVNNTTRRQRLQGLVQQFGMIALNVEEVFHALTVTERGRVHYYQVKRSGSQRIEV